MAVAVFLLKQQEDAVSLKSIIILMTIILFPQNERSWSRRVVLAVLTLSALTHEDLIKKK